MCLGICCYENYVKKNVVCVFCLYIGWIGRILFLNVNFEGGFILYSFILLGIEKLF